MDRTEFISTLDKLGLEDLSLERQQLIAEELLKSNSSLGLGTIEVMIAGRRAACVRECIDLVIRESQEKAFEGVNTSSLIKRFIELGMTPKEAADSAYKIASDYF